MIIKTLTSFPILSIRNNFKNLKLISCFSTSSQNEQIKKTPLYDLHLKYGGKMVNFADHLMPILYKDLTIVESHLHTRKRVSLFDVSHMLQTKITGKNIVR